MYRSVDCIVYTFAGTVTDCTGNMACLSSTMFNHGKSYIEHQAAQNGTSCKAKSKAAIGRLIPVSYSLEDFLARLQQEGYEVKRGKYISARAPDQEQFIWLKTLGDDYTE